jgi:phosphopantothenoylcysteine decarboxylase
MNTFMYEHPLTAEHLRVVRDVIKYNVVGPIGKALACGDIGMFLYNLPGVPRTMSHQTTGMGAMTEWREIVKIVVDSFQLQVG